ncbi:hypothetical protein FSP39_016026 [Pinctada imbricata]|uniref:Reverse transcriptase domain-containing protein n=1 Tax=Pinctada imbricata TaxID=66713 RepID=A0AA89BUZ1_PINIB|nr:hypothetical protein FSP39_016026 [Pinctada imbricata]
MFNFQIDNIFVVFGGKVFQQIVGIPMGTNCAPLLANIFLYLYEAELIYSVVSEGKKFLASDFNFTYRYIDDLLSINNLKFTDYLSSIYPSELEVKETTETNDSASYLDIMLSYDTDGHMNTSLYDKRDDFNISITNVPFLSSNIPSPSACGVFISQLIRYARASTKYRNFILRARRLSDKVLSQGYVCGRLTSSLSLLRQCEELCDGEMMATRDRKQRMTNFFGKVVGEDQPIQAKNEVRLAQTWAEDHKAKFPPVPKFDETQPVKKLYILEDENDPLCPVIMHFVLINRDFKIFSSPGVKRETRSDVRYAEFDLFEDKSCPYNCTNFKYTNAEFDKLSELVRFIVLNHEDEIKKQIKKVYGRRAKTT